MTTIHSLAKSRPRGRFPSPLGSGRWLAAATALSALVLAPAPVGAQTDLATDEAMLVRHLLDRGTRDLLGALDAWRNASGEPAALLAQEIQAMAAERHEVLLRAARIAPGSVGSLALTGADRSDVETLAPGTTAAPEILQGTLSVLVADEQDGPSAGFDRLVRLDPHDVELSVMRGGGQGLVSGTEVQVEGLRVGGVLVIDEDDLVDYQPGNPACPPSATYDLLLVHCEFPGEPWTFPTISSLEVFYNTDVASYYDDVSGGRIQLTATGYPGSILLEGLEPTVACQLSENETILDAVEPVLVNDPDVDLGDYEGLVLFAPWAPAPTCRYAGAATLGQKVVPVPGCPAHEMSVAYIGQSLNGPWINIHELGHNMGMFHASLWAGCNPPSILSPNCYAQNYGDYLSVMGNTVGYLNSRHLDLLGWFEPNELELVTAAQSFTLAPLSGPTAPKALKIQRGPSDYLYVESRKPIGLDDNPTLNGSNAAEGAMLYFYQEKLRSLMIDPLGRGEPEAALLPGDGTWTDPCTKTRVTVTNDSPVQVAIEPGPCNDFVPPAVDVTYPLPNQTVGGTVTVTIDVQDASGIRRVELWRDGDVRTLIGEAFAAPYEIQWKTKGNFANGPHSLVAVAYDDPGFECCANEGESESLPVVVFNNAPGGPPLHTTVTQPPVSGGSVQVPFTAASTPTADTAYTHVEYWLDPASAYDCGVGPTYTGFHPEHCLYRQHFPAYSRYFPGTDRRAFLIGVDGRAPFEWEVDSLPSGSFDLWSRAHNPIGGAEVSSVIPFTVD